MGQNDKQRWNWSRKWALFIKKRVLIFLFFYWCVNQANKFNFHFRNILRLISCIDLYRHKPAEGANKTKILIFCVLRSCWWQQIKVMICRQHQYFSNFPVLNFILATGEDIPNRFIQISERVFVFQRNKMYMNRETSQNR